MTRSPNPERIVHYVDDDEMLRQWLMRTLQSVGYQVQTYATAAEFLAVVDRKQPCCIIIDLLLPGMTGLRLCQQLVAMRIAGAVVMISGHGDLPTAVEAMKLGAVDFLEKPLHRERLVDAVNRALELAQLRFVETLEEEEAGSRLKLLSPREREIFDRMASGQATKEIASKLGISPKTVDVHRSKIMQKLRLDSPTQLGHVMFLHRRRAQRHPES